MQIKDSQTCRWKRDYFLASKDLKNIFEISRKERFIQIINPAGEI